MLVDWSIVQLAGFSLSPPLVGQSVDWLFSRPVRVLNQLSFLQRILFTNMTVNEIGNEFLHELVTHTIDAIQECVSTHSMDLCHATTLRTSAISSATWGSIYFYSVQKFLQFIPRQQVWS